MSSICCVYKLYKTIWHDDKGEADVDADADIDADADTNSNVSDVDGW